jgi:hypothetical protein
MKITPGYGVLEKKADKLWCHWSRVHTEVSTGVFAVVNRTVDNVNPQWARCIATKCVYWERIKFSRIDQDYIGGCSLRDKQPLE